jgi:hypothetical protein
MDLTSDTDSVDGDDYDFFFRNPSTFTESNTLKASIPPVMTRHYHVDVVQILPPPPPPPTAAHYRPALSTLSYFLRISEKTIRN